MKSFAQAAAGLALVFSAFLSACTDSLDELQDALKLPAVTEETKAVFAAAISDVTLHVVTETVTVARDITSAVEAPPAVFSALADAGPTITVNKTVLQDGGGKIVITGTVNGTGTQAKGSVTVDLKAVWTELPVKGGLEKTSGSQSLKGSMGWNSAAGDDADFTLNVDVTGSFELNGESFAFDVVVTMNGGTFAFTGSVNGQRVSGNQTVMPPTRPVEGAPVVACVYVGENSSCEPAPEGGGEPTCTSHAYEFCVSIPIYAGPKPR